MIGAFILRYHLTNDFFSIRIIDRNACTWILHFLQISVTFSFTHFVVLMACSSNTE